jgi:hypothetical protein
MFWIASSVIFMANAILSFVHGEWRLAVLETATGILALISAASVARSRRRPRTGIVRPAQRISTPGDDESARYPPS